MATSKIALFKTHITPARNALVDDIEDYLASLTATYSNNTFQYLKLDLNIDVIVPMAQSTIAGHSLGNYCRIVEDTKIWYYFIINTEWVSTDAVKLKLSIDSINTFRNDLTWDKKTTIARQHMNRLASYDGTKAVRVIDRQPENINVIKHRVDNYPANQTGKNYDWYLMYRTAQELSTENPNNPINCYLFASSPLVISKTGGGASETLTTSDLPEGQFNYVIEADNPSGSFSAICDICYDGRNHNYATRTFTLGGEYCIVEEVTHSTPYGPATDGYQEKIYQLNNFKFVYDGVNIKMIFDGEYLRDGAYHTYTGTAHDVTFTGYVYQRIDRFTPWSAATTGVSSLTINELNFTRVTYDGDVPFKYAQQLIEDTVVYNIGTQVTRSTIALTSIDKTDSRIVKIIKLPYCPVDVTYSGGVYHFPNVWTYENGLMRLNDASLSTEFVNTFYSFNPTNILDCTITGQSKSVTASRNIKYESKLYNSDFYTFKYAYDSFANEIQWERFKTVQWAVANRPNIDFSFKATNTINSKFDIYANYSNNYDCTQDYEGHLLINRNNEETIFSNDFINYIRTGYNYDKKAKDQSTTMGYLTAGLSLVGAIAAFAASTVTGGVSVAAGIALSTSAIAAFAGAASTQQSNERALESKVQGLKAQATGVAGADDVDLMTFYNGNRMRIISYSVDTEQRNAIWNLFFYCGYAHNATEIPNLTSRYWFNYIMCKPVFKEEGVTPYNEYIDDIKARYAAGVTVYHHHETWDWDQQYENWENYIAENFALPSSIVVDDPTGTWHRDSSKDMTYQGSPYYAWVNYYYQDPQYGYTTSNSPQVNNLLYIWDEQQEEFIADMTIIAVNL